MWGNMFLLIIAMQTAVEYLGPSTFLIPHCVTALAEQLPLPVLCH